MTTIEKDCRGNWRAESQFELSNNRVLQFITNKVHTGSIVTRASVLTREGKCLSHMVYQDFSKCMSTSNDRCTAKNVTALHTKAMEQIDEVYAAVAAHYEAALV
jgi:hypothetical protein